MTVDEAIKLAKELCPNEYARIYLDAAAKAIEQEGVSALKLQLLYALNNMQSWRGLPAREVKAVLRSYANSKD